MGVPGVSARTCQSGRAGLGGLLHLGPTYEIFRNPKRQQEHPWRNKCADECNGQEDTLLLGHPIFL